MKLPAADLHDQKNKQEDMHFLLSRKYMYSLFIGQKHQFSAGLFSGNLKIRVISPINDTPVLNFLSYKSVKFSNLDNRLPLSESTMTITYLGRNKKHLFETAEMPLQLCSKTGKRNTAALYCLITPKRARVVHGEMAAAACLQVQHT